MEYICPLSNQSNQTGEESLFTNASNCGSKAFVYLFDTLLLVCPPADLFLDGTDWLPHLLDFLCSSSDEQPTTRSPTEKKAHAYVRADTEWMDAFHASDIRRQTADWADRSGGGMGLRGLLFIWGSHRFVSPTKLISANCNPHQYVLFIIGELFFPRNAV